jgi:hypothetical protein
MRAGASTVRAAPAAGSPRATAPIHAQRRANSWLNELRVHAASSRLIPVRLADAELDLLDAVRSELNLRNGELLGRAPAPSVGKERRFEQAKLVAYLARHHARRAMAVTRQAGVICREMTSVLMVPRLPGHTVDMLPVADALETHYGVRSIFALTDGGLEPALAGRDHLDLYGFAGATAFSAWPRAKAFATRLLSLVRELVPGEEALDLLRCTAGVLGSLGPDALRVAAAAVHLLGRVRPALVLVGNAYTLEGRTVGIVARQMGIPVAVLEHGSIFPGSPVWDNAPVDLVCTWGEASRDALLANGIDIRRTAVTGAPRLDAIVSKARSRQPQSDDYVLVATSGAGDQVSLPQHLDFLERLFDAAAATPELRWLVKLHRKDRIALYEEVQRRHPGARVEVVTSDPHRFGADIYGYLERARALVTVYSTSAADAMVVGVPVISVEINDAGGADRIEFLRHTRRARSAAELADAARAAWRGEPHPTDAGARAYAARHFHNLGHATEAVADRLRELMRRQPGGL